MPRRLEEELAAAIAFYAELDLDVGHFAAQHHTFIVAHLLATDRDRIARRYGLSVADHRLLSALRVDHSSPVRATDLAFTLRVSNAVLTARISKLERKGFLVREPSATDRRAFALTLTAKGAAKVSEVLAAMGREASFVRHFKQLPEDDRTALVRIMGELHKRMERDFAPVSRGKH